MRHRSAAPGGGTPGHGRINAERADLTPNQPVDHALEARIDAVISSLNYAADKESRGSAWLGFMALRAQRTAEHVQALENCRLVRVGIEDAPPLPEPRLGDLLLQLLARTT
jgi:hypothetical protein